MRPVTITARYGLICLPTLLAIAMSQPHDSRNLFLSGPVGRLEAILWTPHSSIPPPLAALVGHPHPLFGGTMHNKVVYQAAKSIDALGIPVLRFNFRGAGLSAGVHDLGHGEQDDVCAALQFLSSEFPKVPLLLAGFSFGSVVVLRVGCKVPEVSNLIALGIPVNNADVSFLSECRKPKLFVHGSDDEHGALRKVEALVPSLPGENRLVIVQGVDHFFTGKLGELDHAITGWLRERVPGLKK
jgi:alpha/beta superfamily hydrolase